MNNELPSIPDGLILYAIGDIHGRADKLRELLTMIEKDARAHPFAQKQIVGLGDYIDRGPDSKSVIDIILYGLPEGFSSIFLRGNHEDSAKSVLEKRTDRLKDWLQHGGDTTLASYGIDVKGRSLEDLKNTLPAEFSDNIPREHREFLQSGSYTHECGDYFFVHAGVRPGIALDQQNILDLTRIRHDFLLSAHNFGKVIVHGHTVSDEIVVRPNRIGIDTGAYRTSGRLSCVKLSGSIRDFIMV